MRARMSAEDFIKEYMETYKAGGCSADIAKKLGWSREGVRCRTYNLKSKGVLLPKLKRNAHEKYNKENIAKLNLLVKKLGERR